MLGCLLPQRLLRHQKSVNLSPDFYYESSTPLLLQDVDALHNDTVDEVWVNPESCVILDGALALDTSFDTQMYLSWPYVAKSRRLQTKITRILKLQGLPPCSTLNKEANVYVITTVESHLAVALQG
ncbi:hypothetical protein PsorP6_004452 [Peronosclerospora sorghi]|uniref:Uncharacterized protein n=1 Tax=Peronosclerospora sorghi TaxID=230839 RepID=A0ACC0VNT4_9STRA|nr:hypothetical protein PsorP6_004452 [Peronosclerospora sorghi]